MESLLKALEETGARIERDAPLSGHTTWRVGGPAAFLVTVDKADVLARAIPMLSDEGVEHMVLGRGSNVLFSDDGFEGVVMILAGELAEVSIEGGIATAGGGADLAHLASRAAAEGLAGLEFVSSIPGTVGGAVMINAGAFGHSISEVLLSVETVRADGKKGLYETFGDAYRQPLVPRREVVTLARFELAHARGEDVRQRMRENAARRRNSQPGGATAGSVFRNPPGGFAGRLIEECGLKGRAVGGAFVSEIHANFIVNGGSASAEDIWRLVLTVRREVEAKSGIKLEPEVEMIGFERE